MKLLTLRTAFTVLIAIGCETAINARADASPWAYAEVDGNIYSNGLWLTSELDTNPYGTNYSVTSSFQWQHYLNLGGTYAYYDLERNYDGTNVTHILNVTAAATANTSYLDYNDAQGELQIGEDMMLVYFPSSVTDTPPAYVSFQLSYSLQGEVFPESSFWDMFGPAFGISGEPTNSDINVQITGIDSVIPVNQSVLSPVYEDEPLNQPFAVTFEMGASCYWQNYTSTEQPVVPVVTSSSWINCSYIFNGFVNVVDQNGNPVPPGKLGFYYVNATNLAQSVSATSPGSFTVAQPPVSLQVIPGANSITLQWPGYATDYQLETTTCLLNGDWTTNSLPSPSLPGTFFQVTIPATNAAAFFRLQLMN